jgi:hypothetical protein
MNAETRYVEDVRSILMSADKKTLVVLGSKHHYVFEVPRSLLAALSPDLYPSIEGASFSTFKVDADNVTKGGVRLMLKHDAPAAQRAQASSIGFQGTASPVLSLDMRGTRYAAPVDFDSKLAQPLKRAYAIDVIEVPGRTKAVLKAAMTPVTMAADGAIVIGAVVLSPIWLTLLIATH